jgi:caffeoyl-CoA O-methyltransferase
MKRALFLILLSFVAANAQRRMDPAGEQSPPLAKTDVEKRVFQTISDIVKVGETYANVPATDGRMLRLLAEAVNAKNIVEIGTSTGISGLWFCLALDRTGGKLTTFELDRTRAVAARKHFQQAGVERLVTIVEGDAHQNITKLKEPIDVLFIDAEKDGYIDYLNKLLPLVRPGGLILAHNVDMVRDYIKMIAANTELETVLYMQGGGLAVTLKKR